MQWRYYRNEWPADGQAISDIEAEWAEINDVLGASTWHVFPATPTANGPTVSWPGGDWRAFLRVAAELHAPLIYAERSVIDRNALAVFEEELRDDDLPIPELVDARTREGDPFALRLTFAHDGVLHTWSAVAEWHATLCDRLAVEDEVEHASWELERDEQARELAAFDSTAQAWPALLAESRAFYSARNEQDRRSAAAALLPELGAYLKVRDAGPNPMYSRALRVVDTASRMVRDEVLPRKLIELRASAHELADAVALDPDFRGATTKADRERVIRGWIEAQHGLRDVAVVRAVYAAWQNRTT